MHGCCFHNDVAGCDSAKQGFDCSVLQDCFKTSTKLGPYRGTVGNCIDILAAQVHVLVALVSLQLGSWACVHCEAKC